MKYEIRKWNKEKFGKMTFENICRIYSSDKNLNLSEKPPFLRAKYILNRGKKYSIRWNKYEAGANFSGQTIDSDYYVLKGSCEIKIDEETIKIQAEEYFKFPKSKYNFRVTSKDCFEYIAVYKLPDDISIPNVNE